MITARIPGFVQSDPTLLATQMLQGWATDPRRARVLHQVAGADTRILHTYEAAYPPEKRKEKTKEERAQELSRFLRMLWLLAPDSLSDCAAKPYSLQSGPLRPEGVQRSFCN